MPAGRWATARTISVVRVWVSLRVRPQRRSGTRQRVISERSRASTSIMHADARVWIRSLACWAPSPTMFDLINWYTLPPVGVDGSVRRGRTRLAGISTVMQKGKATVRRMDVVVVDSSEERRWRSTAMPSSRVHACKF